MHLPTLKLLTEGVAGLSQPYTKLETILKEIKKLIEKFNGHGDNSPYEEYAFAWNVDEDKVDDFMRELKIYMSKFGIKPKKAGPSRIIGFPIKYNIEDLVTIDLHTVNPFREEFLVSIEMTDEGEKDNEAMKTFHNVLR